MTMYNPLETEDEKRRRVLEAMGGSFPTLPETPDLQMGRRIDLPEQVIEADPQRIPGPNAIEPPARMTADEFPSGDPGVPQNHDYELPPEAPGLARLGQMHAASRPEPDAQPAPAHESHSGFGGGMGWALVADALLNRGRGAGGILALGSSGATEDRNLGRDYKRAQIDELQHRHDVSPEAQAYKDAMMQYRWDALHQRGDNASGVQNRFDTTRNDRNDPNSQRNTTQVSQAGATADARTQARLNAEHALVEQTSGDAASVASGRTAGQLETEHNFASTTQADAAAKARAIADATLPSKMAEKAAPGAAPPAVSGSQLVPIPGFSIENEATYGQIQGNASRMEKLQSAGASAMVLDGAVSRMREIAKGGSRLLPDEQKSQYEGAYGDAIGAITEMYHSGVLNQQEYERYKSQLPTLSPGIPDAIDKWSSFSGKPTNTRADMLKGFQESSRELNTIKFRTLGGIRPDYGGDASVAGARPSAEAQPIGSPKRAGYQRDGLPSEGLGVTGIGQGPRGVKGSIADTPDFNNPATSPEGKAEVIRNDDGTFDVIEPGFPVARGVKLDARRLAVMQKDPYWNFQ